MTDSVYPAYVYKLYAQLLLRVDTVWLCQLSLFVIRLTTLSFKGTVDGRQFLIEFIEEYRSLPALWCVTSTEYSNRNKKNEHYANLLNKYKERM